MFDVDVLINGFYEIDHVLIFGLRNVIFNFKELLNILEFSLIFNEGLEETFVLLIANLDEVLSLKDWHDLRHKF
jgi:hypothetical protein